MTNTTARGLAVAVFCLFALAALLWACDEEDAIPRPTQTVTVIWTIVGSMNELQEIKAEVAPNLRDRAYGFATFLEMPDGSVRNCHIYTLYPKTDDDWENVQTIRHEIGHCVAGPWHN